MTQNSAALVAPAMAGTGLMVGGGDFAPLPEDPLEAAIGGTLGRGAPLRQDQKAAIIVRLLLADGGAVQLDRLDTRHAVRLVRAMAGLSYVDEATILAVVNEFMADFDSKGLYFQPGIAGAVGILHEVLADDVKTALGVDPSADDGRDPWPEVAALPAETLTEILARQTPQVAAVVLVKLPAGTAAEILDGLETAQAHAVTLAAATAGNLGARAVSEIGNAIAEISKTLTQTGALPGAATDRVGAVLNFTPGSTREDLLGGLERADPDIADKIRRTMFTFADIPDRIEVKDVPKLVRAIDNPTLVAALAAGQISEKESVEFILANLSKRLAEQLSDDIRDVGEVKQKDGEAAMNAVIQGIRDMESNGEITLIIDEE